MTPQALKKLIAAGESAHVEFKEAFGEASLESIAAFANAGGGVLFIGIADDGTVKGLQLGKETLRDWANKITQATRLNPHISEVFLNGNPVVIIEVLDRILILNPGGLLPPLTLPELLHEHISKPRNHKIAEMLYYAGLIEKWGGGTIEIISSCAKAGLPEPQFEEKQGGLWVTFPKNFITEDYLRSLGLNARQVSAVTYTVKNGRITNSEYQQLCKVSKRTASDELGQIELKGVIVKVGKTGRGTKYQLKGQQRGERGNEGAAKGQN